jgi:hypothetical protein
MDRLMDNVKQKAAAQLDSQKGRATDSISVIANAVRGTTTQLRNDQHDVIAQYVDRVADQLERVSTTLRDKDAGELLSDVRDFARRQPALFIGGSFAVGLLAARFLKSSRADETSAYTGSYAPSSGYVPTGDTYPSTGATYTSTRPTYPSTAYAETLREGERTERW